METTKLHQMAQLAEASYADLEGASDAQDLVNILTDDGNGFSVVQADDFVKNWKISHHQPDQFSGFSATLFESLEQPGTFAIAFRGTAGLMDLSADLFGIVGDGVAGRQVVDMYNYWQWLSVPAGTAYRVARFTPNAPDIVQFELSSQVYEAGDERSTGLGITAGIDRIDVAGHSLGGHLAVAFTRLFEGFNPVAYTFNGAGFRDPALFPMIDRLFDQLAGQSTQFDATRIHNLYGTAGPNFVTQDWEIGLQQLGAHEPLFTESADFGTTFGHGSSQMTDSLGVYSILSRLDPRLSFQEMAYLLESSANAPRQSLESLVNALGDLFATGIKAVTDDRETLYARIQSIQESSLFQQSAGLVRMLPATGFADMAFSDAPEGLAFRYALVHLNPFVITGDPAIHAQHNASGELDLFSPETGQGSLTEQYIQDRASFLQLKVDLSLQDLQQYTSGGENITFSDYSADQSDRISLNERTAGAVPTHLVKVYDFGGVAEDYLQGEDSGDHLFGGAGDDHLSGGAGDDYLEGGQGNDRFIYTSGSGVDTFFDSDGQGSIEYDGTVLTGGRQLTDGIFRSDDGLFTYLFDGASGQHGVLVVNGNIRITHFEDGDLGIHLSNTPAEMTADSESLVGTPLPDVLPDPDDDLRAYDDYQWIATEISGGDGNDFLGGSTEGDIRYGGQGNDWVVTGAGHDWIDGGAGNDIIFPGSGRNLASGDDGDDILLASQSIVLDTDGDASYDALFWKDAGHLFHAMADSGVSQRPDGSLEFRFEFGPPRFSIEGLSVAGAEAFHYDPMAGEIGAISYAAGLVLQVGINHRSIDDASTNVLSGGAGFDLIGGGTGRDYLFGGTEADQLDGGIGDDVLVGGAGSDAIVGDAGADYLSGGADIDQLYGGADDDRLWGDDGNDQLFGDNPAQLAVFHGADRLYGGTGDDQLIGHGAGDLLVGGAGADKLWGGSGDDRLEGGSGDDYLAGDDEDVLLGPQGDDFLIGGTGSDQLYGLDGSDRLLGGSGDDVLSGGDGNDWLDAGVGNDRLNGGADSDLFVFRQGSGIDVIDQADAADRVMFSDIDAEALKGIVVNGTDGKGYLQLSYGNSDRLYIRDGMSGAVGSYKFADGEILDSAELIERLISVPLAYRLDTPGNIYGAGYDDILIGGAEGDRLYGQGGDDILAGGTGDDTLYGGPGHDSYRIGWGTGKDLIVEQADAASTLYLLEGVEVGDIHFQRQQADLYVQLGQGRDGALIKDFFSGEQVWQLEDKSGLLQIFHKDHLPGLTEESFVASTEQAWVEFTQRIFADFAGLLRAYGYQQTSDGAFSGSYTSNNSHHDYQVEFEVKEEFASGGRYSRSSGNFNDQVTDLGREVRTETDYSAAPGYTFIPAGAASGGFVDFDNLVTNGYTGVSLDDAGAGVFGANAIVNPLTGRLEPQLQGYRYFQDDASASLGTQVSRTHYFYRHELTVNIGAISGTDSDDQISAGRGSFALLDGAGGNDVIDGWNYDKYWQRPDAWQVYSDGPQVQLPDGRWVRTEQNAGALLHGGDGDDQLFGSALSDVLIGGAGRDFLSGATGADTYYLFDWAGGDRLFDDGWQQQGIPAQDVLVLPQGVSLQDLEISWGETLVSSFNMDSDWHGRPQSVHATLNISWPGSEGVVVVIPHTDQRAGNGLDFVKFQDGSRIATEVLMTQAGPGPGLDPHMQDNILQASGILYGGGGDDTLQTVSGTEPIGEPGDTGSSNDQFQSNKALLIGGEGRDILQGGEHDDVLLGGLVISDWSTDEERLVGGFWDQGNVFRGGAGGDIIWATAGADVFEFNVGDGRDLVTDLLHDEPYLYYSDQNPWSVTLIDGRQPDTQALQNVQDTLRFGPGVSPADIAVQREQDDLRFSLANNGDGISFQGWFGAAVNQLQRVEFADGSQWDAADIQSLIDGEPLNRPPQLIVPPTNQLVVEAVAFEYRLPEACFSDPDVGDVLNYSVTLDNGDPLPDWLLFDFSDRNLAGLPPLDAAGQYTLTVTVSDRGGLSASADILLTVTDANPPLFGGDADDQIRGSLHSDLISAGAGNDLLDGSSGNDRMDGGTGSDLLLGGAGDDSLVLSGDGQWPNRFVAYNAGSPGHRGSSERIRLQGRSRSHDRFDGGDGWDQIVGSMADEALFLDDGFSPFPDNGKPRLSAVESVDMGAGNDIVDLTSARYGYGDVELNGGAGDDVLWANHGDDRLSGGPGADQLFGGMGADTLQGGPGNDRLQGWYGDDRYRFSRGDGQDMLIEREGYDSLRFDDIDSGELWFHKSNRDLFVSVVGSDDRITLKGWYGAASNRLESFHDGAGRVLLENQVQQLVNAMAAFAPSATGELTLPPEAMESMHPVIAAAWQSA